MRLLYALPVLLLLFSACSGKNSEHTHTSAGADDSAEIEREAEAAGETAILRERAARIAAGLDDKILASQVVFSGIDGRGRLADDMKMLLAECPAGGIMLFRYNLDADTGSIREMIGECSELVSSGAAAELNPGGAENNNAASAAVLPFIAVDHEGGKVNRFRPGVADMPPASFYREMAEAGGNERAIVQINADSFNAGKIINDLGVNFNFAPVVELLNDDNRDFLEDRSYGTDPAFTANASAAFIMGMNSAGILCAVKHFPGSAGPDPHRFPSVLPGDREALAELVSPFAALIRNGSSAFSGQARAVMVSHSSVPAIDSANIASLSQAVMNGWLRQELGFDGIIVSDDFSMASASSPASAGNQNTLKPETAAVQSLAAGADMVLVWPPDLRRTHREIQAALADGRLPAERLREAAERIIFEKLRMGLVRGESANCMNGNE